MKPYAAGLILVLAVFAGSVGGSRARAAQPGNGEEMKTLGTTLPEGRGTIRLSAKNMDRTGRRRWFI